MSVVFRMSQLHFCMWLGCFLTLGSLCNATAKDDPAGLVKDKPAEGPFVETDRGYMVPYKSTIPGTEIEFEMIPIPGGTFQLGSPEDESDRTEAEGPQKTISIEPFWIGKYEVTWDEYKLSLIHI